jgi:hypothetical protein
MLYIYFTMLTQGNNLHSLKKFLAP